MKILSMSKVLRALVFWVGCLEGLGHTEAWVEGQAWFSPLDYCEISVLSDPTSISLPESSPAELP